jgi:hypothetical protein
MYIRYYVIHELIKNIVRSTTRICVLGGWVNVHVQNSSFASTIAEKQPPVYDPCAYSYTSYSQHTEN